MEAKTWDVPESCRVGIMSVIHLLFPQVPSKPTPLLLPSLYSSVTFSVRPNLPFLFSTVIYRSQCNVHPPVCVDALLYSGSFFFFFYSIALRLLIYYRFVTGSFFITSFSLLQCYICDSSNLFPLCSPIRAKAQNSDRHTVGCSVSMCGLNSIHSERSRN